MDDTERIDWLEKQQGSALVSDDCRCWAVVTDGMQNCPTDPPSDIQTTFFIAGKDWHSSVRAAIDAAYKEHGDG